ncbi:MAG: UDP-N-acetylmuramoyl-L-alanine--D-glutamate ligase [Actinomycetota bacterium]
MSDLDLSAPLIVGFGVVGRAVARALVARGSVPVVVEDRPTDAGRTVADEIGVELWEAPDAEALTGRLDTFSLLLPSPGVPDHHPCFAAAEAAGVPMASEFDLARLWDDRPLVAITGTNGKTTVTMMVTDILERTGRKAAAVGNTEVPLIEALDDAAIEVFVVEASSFRLGHSQRFSPAVATWINFAPDHLDAHASLDLYRQAKAAVWAHLTPEAVAIANAEDPEVAALAPEGAVYFALDSSTGAAWTVIDGVLTGPERPVVPVTDLPRRQPHDVANALAAAATAAAAGASIDAIAEGLRAFRGLPHRLELVGEWGGVQWYNDSKATVPQATEAAASGFESVVLIAGGRNKGLSLDGLRRTVPPVRAVIATGDAAGEVTEVFDGLVPVITADSMVDAITRAEQAARPGDVVLLSPGCTSYDWYPNYVERGLDFRRLVESEVAGP